MTQTRFSRFGLLALVAVVTTALLLGGCRSPTATLAQNGAPAPSLVVYLPLVVKSFEPFTPTLTRTHTATSTATPTSSSTPTPTQTATPCNSPTVVFDYVPPYGSDDYLRGHVTCVTPDDYKVAVYINVAGWWTKPYFASPLTTIQSDGTWSTDITTGGSDPWATEIVAFLVPNGYDPPLMAGGATLPQELYDNAVVYTSATRRATRTITFSGYTWRVKFTPILAGPGPNYFSDDPSDVWVDGNGYLHLSIVNRGGVWYNTEVICTNLLQYGAYSITLGSRVDLLDKNVVFGFFSWDDDAPPYYREIDIEFSHWGEDTAQNAQYVIQPWDVNGNRHRFDMTLSGDDSVHRFDWRSNRVQFDSWDGSGSLLQSWTYTNTTYIPTAGAGNARINLWLFNGWAPADSQNVEVIIKSFQLVPASP